MSAVPIGLFEPFRHSVSVDRAVLALLMRWLPTYLRQTEIRENKPRSWLARPRAYTTVYEDSDEDFYSDKQMPTVIVTTGNGEDWQRAGDLWMAHFETTITVVTRGRSMPESRLQGALSIASVTELLIDKPSLEGFANGLRPVSENVRPVTDPANRSRHLCAGTAVYDLFVADIRRGLAGPLQPDPSEDPDTGYDPYPPVDEIDIDLDWHPPTSPLEQ